MKVISKILLMVMLSIGIAQASAFEKTAKFRTTTVNISSEKPLTTGSNTFILELKKQGVSIKDSKVFVKAFMPSMSGMPAMQSGSTAKDLGNGKYKITLNIAMNGTWQVHIFITPKTGRKSRIKTSINF